MKIKEGFVLRPMAGQYIVVAIKEESKKFQGLIRLNDTSKYLWEKMKEGCTEEELVSALMSQYEVNSENAKKDVREFLTTLREAGCLDEA